MDGKKKLDELVAGLDGVTPGPWKVYDGCSWRRIGTAPSLGRNYRDDAVLCPTKSKSDGHPDLTCARGNDLAANLAHIARCDPGSIRSISNAYKAMEAECERKTEALSKIKQWAKAYPLKAFPEPDFDKARDLLEAGGMTLDSISASNMRHVIHEVEEIVSAALGDSHHEG